MCKNNSTATAKVERGLFGFLLHTSIGLPRQPSLNFNDPSVTSCHGPPSWALSSCKCVDWIWELRPELLRWAYCLNRLGLTQPMIQISNTFPWCSAVLVFLEEHVSKMEDIQATYECIYSTVPFINIQMTESTFLGKHRGAGALKCWKQHFRNFESHY